MKQKKWNDKWKFWNSKDAFALVWDVPEQAREITLPHDAMIEEDATPDSPNGGNTGFYNGGSYTYVKFFETKKGDREKHLAIKFEGIYMNAFVYVNGQLAANRPYGYSEFYVPISHLLKEEGTNEIRVQVRNGAMQNSRWYTGSGIYRDVYLLEGGKSYVKEASLQVKTESAKEEKAVVTVSATAVNHQVTARDLFVKFEVLDAKGNVVATEDKIYAQLPEGEDRVSARFAIENPALWSAETPELYKTVVSLYEMELEKDGSAVAGALLDTAEDIFGIRTLELDAKSGFSVNGKEVKLRGACIHHDNGLLGAKTYEEAEYRRVKILKEAGFNAIRMSHHPAATVLLKACDELGMYIMDETFDMWTRCKSDYDYNLFFRDWWKKDVEAMVQKDFNHPSVILYSIGNEIPEIGTDAGSRLAKEISELCHTLDDTRYTLASINGVFAAGDAVPKITADIVGEVQDTDDSVNVNDFMTIMDKYMDKIVVHPEITKMLHKACAATDIAGYNYMTARYALDAEKNPNRVIVGSETNPPDIGTNWREVKKYPQVIGDFTWTGWDYIGEAGVGIPAYRFGEGGFGAQYPAKLAYPGDVDITGFRRPMSYLREIVFGLRKDPYIAVQDPNHFGEFLIKTPWVLSDSISSWSWKGCEQKPCVVEVYAPGEEVELFVNGVSVGKKPCGEQADFRTLFETTYEPGEIRAVSYSNGKAAGEYILKTAEESEILSVTADAHTKAEGELCYLQVAVTDKAGTVRTDVVEKLQVEVSGDAELLGFGSGNPKSEDNYTTPKTTTWNGLAMAIVKAAPGAHYTVKVTAESGLMGAYQA